MSRIGKEVIVVPDGTTVNIENSKVIAKGKLGELAIVHTRDVLVDCVENLINVKPKDDFKRAMEMWGTTRSQINNMVIGVSQGWRKNLELSGVGYRAQLQGKNLVMQLGFSHEIKYAVPEGIKIECPEQTKISILGADKQQVGQVAAEIRAYRPPEPYKGKGVKYEGEYIFRKEGKKK